MDEHESKTTTDHEEIRRWAEERGGRPSIVTRTESGGSGLLRIDFGKPEEEMREISWEDFFRIFEENNLAFLYQDQTKGGEKSWFFKFIER